MRDHINNAFMLCDLSVDMGISDFYGDWQYGEIMGYKLIYTGGIVPIVIIKASKESAEEFLSMLTQDRAIIHLLK